VARAIKKRHITLWVVLLLAVLGWWLQREGGQIQIQPQKLPEVVDYSLTDFVITAMDEHGAPKQRLSGKSMVHYAERDYAEMKQPHLEVYGETNMGGPVQVDAELAKVYQGGDSVLLAGDVSMVRQDPGRKSELQVQTRDLWYFSPSEYAETSADVTIRDELGVTRARGMTMDMKAGTLDLLAAVRGEYVLE